MRLLCLDLSTNSGWALIEDGKLISFGNVRHKVESDETSPHYPLNFINMAELIAVDVQLLIHKLQPSIVVIEETNKGKNRYSQKQLEFIHFAVNKEIGIMANRPSVRYLDTSEWRKLLGLSLDKEQRQQNNVVKKQRNEVRKELESLYNNDHAQELELILNIPKVMARKRAHKDYLLKRELIVKEKMKSFRSKIDGKVTGKIGVKNLSVDFVNEMFDLKFKKKDNDIADAICLGVAYTKKINQPSSP